MPSSSQVTEWEPLEIGPRNHPREYSQDNFQLLVDSSPLASLAYTSTLDITAGGSKPTYLGSFVATYVLSFATHDWLMGFHDNRASPIFLFSFVAFECKVQGLSSIVNPFVVHYI